MEAFFITVTFFINHAFRTQVAFILINYHYVYAIDIALMELKG